MTSQSRQLVVRGIRHEAQGVLSIELGDPDGEPLPPWTPGAHIDVRLASGLVRSYSLCGPQDPHTYRIAVLRVEAGRGGSAEIHDTVAVGQRLVVGAPRNNFPLEPAPHYLFLAGGIGVTPILAMARAAAERGVPWTLIYGGRSRGSMAFVAELEGLGGIGSGTGSGTVRLAVQDEHGLPDLRSAFSSVPGGALAYCCGPAGMIEAVLEAGREANPGVGIRLERFSAAASAFRDDDQPFEVELVRSGAVVAVTPGMSVLEAVRPICPAVMSSCEEGVCSSCETAVLAGVPDHRDSVLTPGERAGNEYMMICVSRALTPRLVLDL